MTPTSPLAGLLTGLVDGVLIACVVLLVVLLTSRRHRTATVVHPVAEDRTRPANRAGELPRPFSAGE